MLVFFNNIRNCSRTFSSQKNGVDHETCLGFGTVVNLMFMKIICTSTRKNMQEFSSILLQTCIVDLYTLAITAIVQPVRTCKSVDFGAEAKGEAKTGLDIHAC